MIPSEAVEAAARIIYRDSGRKRVMSYEKAREACESDARDILEAAAPHMLAEAWEEGKNVRRCDGVPPNPYRTAK